MALVDFQSLLLDPNYLVFGVDAVLTPVDGFPFTLQAIDQSAGVAVGDPSGVQVDTVKPAATIRAFELAEKGLCAGDLNGAALSLNAKTWRVESARPMPTPNGEAAGEIMLFLIEVDV